MICGHWDGSESNDLTLKQDTKIELLSKEIIPLLKYKNNTFEFVDIVEVNKEEDE